MASPLGLPKPAARESTIRWRWRAYLGNKNKLARTVRLFGRSMPVADVTEKAWRVYEEMLLSYDYQGPKKFWTYVKRYKAGTKTWSLHAYPGVAGDMDPKQNPFLKYGYWDDTLFTKELVLALLTIRTNNGKPVFVWGGQWKHSHDLMHWYLVCKPADLATGIDPNTVTLDEGEEEKMKQGDKGKGVKRMQEGLLDQGFSLPKYGADGDFGGETRSAVVALQTQLDLPVTGVIGGITASFILRKAGPAGTPGARGLPGTRGRDGRPGATPNLAEYKLVKQ